MRIKLIKGWNGISAGAEIEPRLDGVAHTLIQRGIAQEIVPESKPEPKKRPPVKLQEWVKKPGGE